MARESIVQLDVSHWNAAIRTLGELVTRRKLHRWCDGPISWAARRAASVEMREARNFRFDCGNSLLARRAAQQTERPSTSTFTLLQRRPLWNAAPNSLARFMKAPHCFASGIHYGIH